ncbi:alpha-2-macroglobulin family protein [Lishizhenia sp.]|uniref:alpha-2-macroglobulin family protein n=1 Tax=Lishizhenia sp. TaxID=2497594 RepID=UPI00299E513C|nr:MG2 domain-containing protein [Lishizhenia sp.]MDX1446488.1 MG2 domain-containing protein [Lishizhenia sp.]
MKKFITFFLATFILFSCSNKEIDLAQIKVNPGFSDYITAFTSGVISNQDEIKVVLVAPVESAVAGEKIEGDLFEFEPSIEGEAYWIDKQSIAFRPNETLVGGQKYKGSFQLNELLEVEDEYETLEFGFMVMHQNLFVEFTGIYTQSNKDYSKQDIKGSVRTGDMALPAMVEACFKATQNGKSLNIIWEHKNAAKRHSFTLTGVERSAQASKVVLSWNGEPIGVEVEEQLEMRVPPLDEFVVVQAKVVQEPGLYFSIQCSDPLDENQDLNGLVYLSSGKKLRLSIDGNEIKAYPQGKMEKVETLVVNKTIRNSKGFSLKKQFVKGLTFNTEKPALELIGDGVIMPSNNGTIDFPFKAVNLKAVNLRILRVFENNVNQFFQENHHNGSSDLARVGRLIYDGSVDLVTSEPIDYGVWNNFKIDLNRYIDSEPGSIYRVMMSYERHQSLYPCGDSTGLIKPLKRREQNYESNEYYMNVDRWFDGGYDYRDKDNPCTDSYYKYYNRQVSRNVLSSNFGIIAKEGADNRYEIAISDLRTTDPLKGITVEAYNFQNQLIATGTTDGDGLLSINPGSKAYLLIAKKGTQRGYLRVDNGSSLSTSLYEVGGKHIEKGIKGHIYGERGVWRPGDSVFLTFALEDKLETLPKNHPVVLEIFDPMGKLYTKKVSTEGVKGLYAFTFKTMPDSPTGKWKAKAIVGNSDFYKYLKIETVKPNRIRINYDLADVLDHSSAVSANLQADWLYGAPAANLKAAVELDVFGLKTTFKGYENYQFDDRSKRYYLEEPLLAEVKTDASGSAKVSFDWEKPEDAPGMLKVRWSTKVFEEGGDFSQDYVSKKYSPFTSYVGLKMDGGTNWRTALNSEDEHAVSIAAVDEDGSPLSRKVKVELYKVSYNWWWEGNGEDDLTNYVSRNSSDLVKSESFYVKNGKANYTLKFPERGWGKYMLRVIDENSGHSAMQSFYADYSGWYADDNGNSEAASMLNLETDKESYDVGETAKITVPSGGIGRFYVTIEKGDQILASYWQEADDKSTVLEIPTTEEMAPNIYVSATLVQPHGQTENALPIRMYGITPVAVSDPATHLAPQITAPETVQPLSDYSVKVKEKDGKAMAYTLAVVDEGLLSLTRFQTPDLWPSFYSKEALSVRTWDMYKYVMSAQTGKMAALLAIGGDEGLVYKEDASANRFKPVVKYLGPFYLEEGEEASHKINMPNYIGAVRVMVVAAHNGAYGSTEKEIQVKQPLMVQATLPRVLGPKEQIKVPVNIIAMSNKIKQVAVKVSSNEYLVAKGSTQQTVNFTGKGDQTIFFDYEVANKLGVGKFKVEVSSGKEKSFEEIEILVRPANPPMTQSKVKSVEGNSTFSDVYSAFGIRGTNETKVEISRIPYLNLEKQLSYLIRYPHGCIEQTTSAVFPQLYLSNFVEMSAAEKAKVQENINAALTKYKSFQTTDGGFSYWPGNSRYVSEWGTNYAGHFMLEAKNKGYELPANMLSSWVKFQKKRAKEWTRE